jgi:hypothetical protein
MHRISTENLQFSIGQLDAQFSGRRGTDDYNADALIHIHRRNRAFVWSSKMQEDLLDTILKGYPTPPIICSTHIENGKEIRKVMDGGNRITTFRRILQGKVKALSDEDKLRVQLYPITLTIMRNLTSADQRIMFRRLNKSVKVNDGQLYAMSTDDSPLVMEADDFLQSVNYPHRERTNKHFSNTGDLVEKNTYPKALANVVALLSGILHGPDFLTQSYNIQDIHVESQEPIQRNKINIYLSWILDIFDLADELEPITKKSDKLSQLSIGKFLGLMVYDRLTQPREVEQITDKWVKYICSVRNNKEALQASKMIGAQNLTKSSYNKRSIKVGIYIDQNRLATDEEIAGFIHYEEPEEDSDNDVEDM